MHCKTIIVIACAIAFWPLWARAVGPTTNNQSPTTQQKDEAKAQDLATQGTEALYRKDYAKAIDLLTQAIAIDKTKTGYRVDLARAHRYAGDDKAAQEVLEAVLKTTPDQIDAGQVLADIYAQQENWKRVG